MLNTFVRYFLCFAFGFVLAMNGITIFTYQYWVLVVMFLVHGWLERAKGQDDVIEAFRK
jgi:hypothetical protein